MDERTVCIPGWKIVRTIGRGGFGAVYEVEKEGDFGMVRHSALKVISIPETDAEIKAYKDDGYDDVSITALFRSHVESITAEFELMSKLKGHSNIVSYEDHTVVQHDNDPGYDIFIRMELLTPLPDYINRQFSGGEIPEKAAIDLGVDMCRALELCRHFNIIHRDIKPQNIFVNDIGDYKLGDFGIAKTSDHTTRATKTGTFGYMAPEVYHSKPYNASVDIYSLGLVMYWMLNERRGPFLPLPPAVPKPSQNAEALDRRMAGEPLPAPKHGSEELKRIVLKACAFDPKDRYASPKEMGHDLEMLFAEADAYERTLKMESGRYDEEIGCKETEQTLVLSEDGVTQLIRPAPADEEATMAAANTSPEYPPVPKVPKNPEPVPADDEATVFLKEPTPVKPAEKPVEPKKEARPVSTNPAKKETKPAEKQQKKKSMLPIILPIAAAAVIAAVVLIVVFAGKGKTSSQTAEQPTAEPVVTAASTPEPTGKWLVAKKTCYNADGNIRAWHEYEYDTDGKLTKYTYADNEYGYYQWLEYEYDANGNTIKQTCFNADGSISWRAAFEYDANGNAIKQTDFDADGSISWWCEYEYNNDGKQLKSTSFNADGSISGRYENEYDTDGKQIKYTGYNADGSISGWYEYEYNNDGKQIKYTGYNADGSISGWYEYEYNNDGKQLKSTYFNADGSISRRAAFEYDANGNVIKQTDFDADGSISGWTEYEWLYCNPLTAEATNAQHTNDATIETEATPTLEPTPTPVQTTGTPKTSTSPAASVSPSAVQYYTSPTSTMKQNAQKGVVIAGNVTMRKGPGQNFETVRTDIEKGTEVTLYVQQDEWWFLKCGDQYGYILKDYVQKNDAMTLEIRESSSALYADENGVLTVTGTTLPGAMLTTMSDDEANVLCRNIGIDTKGNFSFQIMMDPSFYGASVILIVSWKEGSASCSKQIIVRRGFEDKTAFVKHYSQSKKYYEVPKNITIAELLADPAQYASNECGFRITAIVEETLEKDNDVIVKMIINDSGETVYVYNFNTKWAPDESIGKKYNVYCNYAGINGDTGCAEFYGWFAQPVK